MTERLLQFIWQFQHFNKSELRTEEGEVLQIMHPGNLNSNQGADFSGARIRIGETTWAGNIELHIHTSDWHKHSHHSDPNYKNIILHVVWNNDRENSNFPQQIPTLELQSRVPGLLLQRYGELMNNLNFVPCEKSLPGLNPLIWEGWKQRLLVERLQRKSTYILELFKQSNHHWEETFWWMIARNFGIRVNTEAFEAVAHTIPVNLLAKHKSHIHQLEALLFGQAGLLEQRFEEKYPLMLQKEYRFYLNKYHLRRNFVAMKFLRMRPSSFPSVRLAQLAALVHRSTHLFASVKEINSVTEASNLLHVTANDYWNYHYRFDELSDFKKKNLGEDMVNNILINTVVPILFTYGCYQSEPRYTQRSLEWLGQIAGEKNRITNAWTRMGVENRHAYDSQSLIELKSGYCDIKRCLECSIGNALLRRVSP